MASFVVQHVCRLITGAVEKYQREVREVDGETAVRQRCSDAQVVTKHLFDAKEYMEDTVKQLKTSGQDIQTQVSPSIPKQVQEMKASIIQTFDKLEKLFFAEAQQLGTKHTNENDKDIAKWQSRIEPVNARTTLTKMELIFIKALLRKLLRKH